LTPKRGALFCALRLARYSPERPLKLLFLVGDASLLRRFLEALVLLFWRQFGFFTLGHMPLVLLFVLGVKRYPLGMPDNTAAKHADIHAVCLANIREAWSALRMIREALEQHCPPGTVPNGEHLEPTFMAEAAALVKAIDVLANHPRRPKS
jgi:hypothetical protein